MMRITFGLLALLLMVGCSRHIDAPYRPPLVVVFADVTDSLKGEELQAVHDGVADILDRAPENTMVVIYPIEANMAYVKNLFDQTVPVAHDVGPIAIKIDGQRRKAWASKITGELSTVAKYAPPHAPVSCLADALRRAAKDIESLEEIKGRPIDIVLITDMVEECDHSIGDKKIRLNHAHIDADIKAAKAFTGLFADLRNANVYFIYPPGSNSGFDINRPRASAEELEAFWNAVLSHCNVHTNGHFLAGTGLYRPEWKSTARRVADASPSEEDDASALTSEGPAPTGSSSDASRVLTTHAPSTAPK